MTCRCRLQYEYTFRVQMLEIYNENLRDLLADGRSHANARLDILATQASGCNVPGATQVSTHVPCWLLGRSYTDEQYCGVRMYLMYCPVQRLAPCHCTQRPSCLACTVSLCSCMVPLLL